MKKKTIKTTEREETQQKQLNETNLYSTENARFGLFCSHQCSFAEKDFAKMKNI